MTTPEYDAFARDLCSPKQLQDLARQPAGLPLLDHDELIADAWRMKRAQTAVADIIRDEIDAERPSPIVMQAAMRAEYLLRTTCCHFADELERRRTGVAPRARKLN
jgi:hypothetical protein